MKVLAVIPARGGSKGIKNKNIRIVAGEPLISYSIGSAAESKLLTRTVVSTDSSKIADIAHNLQNQVIMRPAELAGDDTPIVPVITHALDYCEREFDEIYDLVVLLQPTSPIRSGEDIDAAVNLLIEDPQCNAVISVVAMQDCHPARMYNLDKELHMKPLMEELETARRQDIEPVYYRNGAIYVVRKDALLAENNLMVRAKKAYVMPLNHLVNIDDERDMQIANILVNLWKNGEL